MAGMPEIGYMTLLDSGGLEGRGASVLIASVFAELLLLLLLLVLFLLLSVSLFFFEALSLPSSVEGIASLVFSFGLSFDSEHFAGSDPVLGVSFSFLSLSSFLFSRVQTSACFPTRASFVISIRGSTFPRTVTFGCEGLISVFKTPET